MTNNSNNNNSSINEELNNVPVEIRSKLNDFIQKINQTESLINCMESKSLKEIHSTLSPIDAAKFDWVSVYSLNSLYFAYLKCSGVLTKDHPLMSELNRIRNYMLRITEIVRKEEEKKKGILKIDKDSSARIIKRSLWQNANKNKNSKNNQNDKDDYNDSEIDAKRVKNE